MKPTSFAHQILSLEADASFARAWVSALTQGFEFQIPGPMTVRDLLTHYVGLDPEYVQGRITTIFLGGHPVDDIDTALVSPGDELSLSTAMPGVAGVVMGRNNPFKGYRADISYHETKTQENSAPGLILVKLFNFIAPETAEPFMARGIGLSARNWERFTKDLPNNFWDAVTRATLDENTLDAHGLKALTPVADEALRFVRVLTPGACP